MGIWGRPEVGADSMRGLSIIGLARKVVLTLTLLLVGSPTWAKTLPKIDGIHLCMPIQECEEIQAKLGRRLRYDTGITSFQDEEDFTFSGNQGPRIWFDKRGTIVRIVGVNLTVDGVYFESGDTLQIVQKRLGDPVRTLKFPRPGIGTIVYVYPTWNLAVCFNAPEDAEPTVQVFLLDCDEGSLTL